MTILTDLSTFNDDQLQYLTTRPGPVRREARDELDRRAAQKNAEDAAVPPTTPVVPE